MPVEVKFRGGGNKKELPSVASAAWFRFSSADRTALAAALIVGILLVAVFRAPAGAVLGGCGLALAVMFINSRRRRP